MVLDRLTQVIFTGGHQRRGGLRDGLEGGGPEIMAFSLSARLQYPGQRLAMRGRGSVLLLPIALAVAPAILAQTLSTPAFVVPTFADLMIKKRQSFGTTSSMSTTDVLSLKGARERREFLDEQSGNSTSHYVTIMQCDQRRSVQLNPEAKLYS